MHACACGCGEFIHMHTSAEASCFFGVVPAPLKTAMLCPPFCANTSRLPGCTGVWSTPKSGALFFRIVGMRNGPWCSKAMLFLASRYSSPAPSGGLKPPLRMLCR